MLAEDSFGPSSSGLLAQHAPAAGVVVGLVLVNGPKMIQPMTFKEECCFCFSLKSECAFFYFLYFESQNINFVSVSEDIF